MKENKYDDEIFFDKYSQMSRSKEGPSAAGEWEALKSQFPSLEGKKLLDLGCGYGWHCIYAMENGAASAVGVDISQKMLTVAREKTKLDNVSYICEAMEAVEFPNESFDVILSSLAFHYVSDYNEMIKKIYKWLKPNGSLIFSAEHPIFTAEGSQNWSFDSEGNISHFPVDNYYYEGKREAEFLGERVTKYHRTVDSYINGVLDNNFELLRVIEPQPSEEMRKNVPGMEDEMRRPMMIIISARKK